MFLFVSIAVALALNPNNIHPARSLSVESPFIPTAAEPASSEKAKPDYLSAAEKLNVDVAGWIKIDHTQINYPVVIADNNDFYVNQDINKNVSKSGAIFLDYRNNEKNQRRHLIIYGHNLKDGTMFHDLNAYKQKDFLTENNQITLWIWGEERTYEIYAQFIITTDVNFAQTMFKSDKQYFNFITALQSLSKFPSDIELTAKDEILSLNTCTYEYTDARLVLQARRIS